MQKPGEQYSKDDKTDPTGFLRRARLHQSAFRAEYLNLPFDTYGNYLTKEDGEKGNNFYDGFGIFDAVKNYCKYNKQLYSNLLRSEHIPFNFFIPLDKNRDYCKAVLSKILNTSILSINEIKIEYAPKPKKNYLNDRTSFDVYIEYSNPDGTKGIVGIEVKYTEKEYKLQSSSKQKQNISEKSSPYYTVTNNCQVYKPDAISVLVTDKFRQLWRNQILGESILLSDRDIFQYFTSLILYPSGNSHFKKTSKEYIELLTSNNNKFIALTYEDFFELLTKYCPDTKYSYWINYLRTRYIV